MKHKLQKETLRFLMYTFMLCSFFALQSSPGLLSIGGMKPNLVLAFCIHVAVIEGEFPGALFGALGGLLLDFSAGTPMGYYGLVLMFVCFLTSAIIHRFLRPTLQNALLVLLLGLVLVAIIDFFLRYTVQYKNAFAILDFRVVGKTIYTMVVGVPLFHYTLWLHRKSGGTRGQGSRP